MKTRSFIILQHILPQHFLSRLVARLANWQAPEWFLLPMLQKFVRHFNVDMQIAAEPRLTAYNSFNDFFTRKLAANARPIGDGVVSPADGTISELGPIAQQDILQAKGCYYTLKQLLANDEKLAAQFANGFFATIYLSPRDYHRVHMPYAGKLLRSIYVPGKLFSVNPTTVQNVAGVFARNERLINIFSTDKGPMAVILVGAMLVAGISASWRGTITPNRHRTVQSWDYTAEDKFFNAGDEVGYFNFGSTAIVLFPEDSMQWLPELAAETTLKMGQTIGH
jgi:phosphatidylserine decarboxylase